MNAVLEQYLCYYVYFHQDNCMDLRALAEFVYNNAQHALTRMSLLLVTYGFHLRLFPLTMVDSLVPVAADFLQELTSVYQVCGKN